MRLFASSADTRGVSPVVGVILMVAVTVLLSAAVFSMVTSMTTQQSAGLDDAQQSGVSIERSATADGGLELDVTVMATDDTVYYRVNDGSLVEIGESGDSVTLTEGTDFDEGDSVTVVSKDDSGTAQFVQSVSTEPIQAGSVPSEGLVSHWRYEEDSGDIAYDETGVHNGTTYDVLHDRYGVGGSRAYEYDGLNSYITVQDHADYDFDTGFTVATWVRFDGDNSADNWQGVISKGPSSDANQGFALTTNNDGTLGQMMYRYDGTNAKFGFEPQVGSRYHIVLMANETSARLLVDGGDTHDETLSVSSLPAPTDNVLYIAQNHWNTGDRLYGMLDETYVYDRSLNASEAKALYEKDA